MSHDRDAEERRARGRKKRRRPRRLRSAAPSLRGFIAMCRSNFGVDLDPPSPDRATPVAAGARSLYANLRAFGRALLLTRLDRSGAHPHAHRSCMAAAYAVHRRQARRARRVARSAADAEGRRRPGRLRRAAGPSRPQRRDPRHRRQDHVGVRRAEPDHRQGRGRRTHHRRAARRRRQGIARAARLEEGLRLGQAPDHARRSRPRSSTSACPASASCPRTSASIRTGRSAPMCSATSTRTMSASPAWRNISTSRA